MSQNHTDTIQVRAGSRTYFVDREVTAGKKPYLKITESRFKGKTEQRERSSIVVFPEHAKEFAKAVMEMVAALE